MYVSVCVWRRLAARLIRLGVWKGVERRTSPYRLKNYAPHTHPTPTPQKKGIVLDYVIPFK